MITARIHRRERVFGLRRAVSGTQPPALLINKFMYEEEKKCLLVGFQSVVPPPSPAISLSLLRAAEQNYSQPADNKEVHET